MPSAFYNVLQSYVQNKEGKVFYKGNCIWFAIYKPGVHFGWWGFRGKNTSYVPSFCMVETNNKVHAPWLPTKEEYKHLIVLYSKLKEIGYDEHNLYFWFGQEVTAKAPPLLLVGMFFQCTYGGGA